MRWWTTCAPLPSPPYLGAIQAAGLAQPGRAHGLGLGRFRNAALCHLLQRRAPMRNGKAARARGVGHRGGVSVAPLTLRTNSCACLARRLQFTGEPADGVGLQGVYGE